MSKLTKIFVTKYALTVGPQVVMAEVKYEGGSAFWWVGGYHHSAHGKDFWLTKEEALADCERRRKAKLASIDKQAKKIQAMTFTIKELADGQ
ncbi:hypothetical protein I5P68_10470 [Serratia ureilytica]|uniref:hypothetical protein n=1 Tax=Serratia TaxID=613 RepID=UPI0004F8172A|nr:MULTISPECIES: hypothetical protein [Serratia]AIM22423.1 hypothetical protein SERRSCBI_14125 [Serratia sp. SCBI]MBH2720185.1 hypothetical protein [Serratia ureilytica]